MQICLVGKYAEDINEVLRIVLGRDISEEATPEDYVYLLSAIIYRIPKSFLNQ